MTLQTFSSDLVTGQCRLAFMCTGSSLCSYQFLTSLNVLLLWSIKCYPDGTKNYRSDDITKTPMYETASNEPNKFACKLYNARSRRDAQVQLVGGGSETSSSDCCKSLPGLTVSM